MPERPIPPSLAWLAGLILLTIGTALVAGAGLYGGNQARLRAQANASTRGDRIRGEVLIYRYAFGICHIIPGIHGAVGRGGPDLTHVGQCPILAGSLSSDPGMMVRWLMHPQLLSPGSGMPEKGMEERQARDIAAYLYAQDRTPNAIAFLLSR
jgi:cytochrome c